MPRLFPILLAFVFSLQLHAETLEFTGRYQGKDLIVSNSLTSDSSYCVTEVRVNGKRTSDRIESHAFAIDLGALDLALGDSVHVAIDTKEDCGVRVVNAQVLEVRSTCLYTFAGLDMEGLKFTWKTEEEVGKLPFVVQQFRWNRWMNISEVMGKGTPEENTYHVSISTHHGENRFRVYQQDLIGRHFSDPVVAVNEVTPEVRITTEKIRKSVSFSSETDYEVYNAYGQLLIAGRGATIDLSTLEKGTYYLNFGNKSGEAIRKR